MFFNNQNNYIMENLVLAFVSLVIGVIAAAVIFIPETRLKNKARSFGLLSIIYSALSFMFFYYTLPSPARPLLGLFGFTLFILWCLSLFLCSFYLANGIEEAKVYNMKHQRVIVPKKIKGLENVFPAIYIIAFLIFSLISHSVTDAGKPLSASISEARVNLEKNTKHYWGYNPESEKIISLNLAIIYANRALEQNTDSLKNCFEVKESTASLQIIKGEYWYIIPLDFKDKKSWELKKTVPGYFKVYAQDPWCAPLFVSGLKMKYTPEAYYANNLARHLYPKFYNRSFTEYSLVENEVEKPFWVIEVAKTSYFSFDVKSEGKIILDPETGTYEYVLNEVLWGNAKYAWIEPDLPVNTYRTDIIIK